MIRGSQQKSLKYLFTTVYLRDQLVHDAFEELSRFARASHWPVLAARIGTFSNKRMNFIIGLRIGFFDYDIKSS